MKKQKDLLIYKPENASVTPNAQWLCTLAVTVTLVFKQKLLLYYLLAILDDDATKAISDALACQIIDG